MVCLYLGPDYGSADADDRLGMELRAEGVNDRPRQFLQVLGLDACFDFLDKHNIRLADIEDKILLLVREEILNDLISGDVVGGNDPDQQSYPVDVDVEMQLPGLDVDSAGQDIVQNYIFNEVIAVIFLIVVLLDAGEGDGQNRRVAGGHIIGALDKDSIVRLDVRPMNLSIPLQKGFL